MLRRRRNMSVEKDFKISLLRRRRNMSVEKNIIYRPHWGKKLTQHTYD